ncbi:Lrp/AsnC family transcriptional regulator [Pseudonocardia acaciae]|uniref:Lrp/AsnC family transcriptional regulator n=1 Tax=Pseudonocardia acaciae TaxID=551276 RepID=UPI0005684C4E|nr:Lrp/AsnC family transcriptional regulator [Pseudonocardia acaciae]
MDDMDRRILHELGQDARTSLAHLAHVSGLAASSVKRRIARLEELGVIKGYTVRLDHHALGLGLQALIGIFAATGTTREQLTDALTGQEEIVRAWTTAGNADALALIRARDTDHLEQIILRLQRTPGIAHTRTQIFLSELLNRGD